MLQYDWLIAATVLEHTAIIERNKKYPATHLQDSFIDAMQKSVTKPLWQDYGAEIVREHIIDTEIKLINGFIRGVRELEVMLITSTDLHVRKIIHRLLCIPDRSQGSHDEFLKSVATRYNSVMQPADLYWRNEYYIADLNLIIKLKVERESHGRYLGGVEPHALTTNDLPLDEPQRSFNRSSALSIGSHAPASMHPGPSTEHYDISEAVAFDDRVSEMPNISPPAFTSTLAADPTVSSVTSPNVTPRSSRSSSPLYPIVSTVADTNLRCDRCNEITFRGTLKSQRRNLRRHMHTVHGIDERLSCPVPGCNETFAPGRGDNRKRHMKSLHGVAPLPMEPHRVKKRRNC